MKCKRSKSGSIDPAEQTGPRRARNAKKDVGEKTLKPPTIEEHHGG